jgi:hypothetical protein
MQLKDDNGLTDLDNYTWRDRSKSDNMSLTVLRIICILNLHF